MHSPSFKLVFLLPFFFFSFLVCVPSQASQINQINGLTFQSIEQTSGPVINGSSVYLYLGFMHVECLNLVLDHEYIIFAGSFTNNISFTSFTSNFLAEVPYHDSASNITITLYAFNSTGLQIGQLFDSYTFIVPSSPAFSQNDLALSLIVIILIVATTGVIIFYKKYYS